MGRSAIGEINRAFAPENSGHLLNLEAKMVVIGFKSEKLAQTLQQACLRTRLEC